LEDPGDDNGTVVIDPEDSVATAVFTAVEASLAVVASSSNLADRFFFNVARNISAPDPTEEALSDEFRMSSMFPMNNIPSSS
jgi:hypothetical protein